MRLNRDLLVRVLSRGTALTILGALAGCGTPPPASKLPTARAAVDRVHATQDCGLGIHASAKIDSFGKGGRVRGDLLAFAVWPELLRMDVVSPFGVTLATLASDGKRFSLYDLREKRFFFGPASACNIARLTTVPMPGHVLVSLLRGEAPVLKHGETDATIVWDTGGYYVVTINGTNGTVERIQVAPHPADFALPWEKQRLRVLDVEVKQQDIILYHAELSDHKPAPMDKPIVDPDGLDPPTPTSGPMCTAELPRRIHVKVPGKKQDVLFRYDTVTWNPPLPAGTFTQPIPPGVEVVRVTCDDK
jgi:outer membrane lipoprotein-sorting protein